MIPFLKNLKNYDPKSIFIIAGPCVVESMAICDEIANFLKDLCDDFSVPFIFKASFKKANRTKLDSFTGIGDLEALTILAKIRDQYKVPVLTDIHSINDVELAKDYVDILQIPAFLSRQTDILMAAGQTGQPINIKKGQFLSPTGLKYAVEKIEATNNQNILLTERGSFFGYQDLVVDFRSIPEMKMTGYPVIFDGTHSLQTPNSESGVSGGKPSLILPMSKAAVAIGADGLFIETHPRPEDALSDGANMLPMNQFREYLDSVLTIKKSMKS